MKNFLQWVSHVLRRSEESSQDDTPTMTGETFEERKAYHQRGELSPGEHALARAIRISLEERKTSE